MRGRFRMDLPSAPSCAEKTPLAAGKGRERDKKKRGRKEGGDSPTLNFSVLRSDSQRSQTETKILPC